MNKKSINLGFRGWMLIIYQATAFMTYQVFTNFPLNILADYYGGATKLSTVYTVCAIIGILIQLVLSGWIGKVKSIKLFSSILGGVSLLLGLCIMLIPFENANIWLVCYGIENITSLMYATFLIGILVGQWFPRRKGTVMGIATLAFPLTNGTIGLFASSVYSKGYPDVFSAFLPFFIIALAGWIIGQIFTKDYPEQCGCYRDNDRSMTPEAAKQMMLEEQENKKTSVWTLKHTFTCRDFWFTTIAMGFLLMFSIGLMTQTSTIIGMYEEQYAIFGGYTGVMVIICILGCLGSYLIGLLDTKIGTKKALLTATFLMAAAGILGAIPSAPTLFIALMFLALFQGASSNFTVSMAAQYWRREDFSNVFACINPVANILSAFGPMLVARLLYSSLGYQSVFAVTAVCGIVSIILVFLFNSNHIREKDNKYRSAAGKTLDAALEGRK